MLLMTVSLHAGKLPSADEAVRNLFDAASYERETYILTVDEQAACLALAAQDEISALVTRYIAFDEDGTVIGYAYLDKHLVRTLPQTLMVAIDADGALVGIETLAFREPVEYMAGEGWMAQFTGKKVEDELRMKKNIDGITGATLTSRAITQCARRQLAVDRILNKRTSK